MADTMRADDHSQLRIVKFYGWLQLKAHWLASKEERRRAEQQYNKALIR